MDAQRQAFLEEIQADLNSAARPGKSRAKGIAAKLGAVGSVAAASVGLLAATVSPAEASPAPKQGDAVHAKASCAAADPIPQSQSKWCGTQNYYFAYTGFKPAGPHTCYFFDLTIYHAACGGTVHVGGTEACD